MISIGKRAACIGAVAAVVAAAAPVASADTPTALPAPAPLFQPTGPAAGAFQAGTIAAVGGWNAGADAAIAGLNAGGAALGVPFQLTVQTRGPLGLHVAGLPPLDTTP